MMHPLIVGALAVTAVVGLGLGRGQVRAADEMGLPAPVTADQFDAMMSNSPFLRTLSITETYALRGVANIGGKPVATLYNKETKKSVIVSQDQVNEQGMQMVSVKSPRELENVAVTISFAGENVELKYDPIQITPTGTGGSSSRFSGSRGPSSGSDGDRRGPSAEDRARYEKLTEPQREKLREYIRATYTKYPDMSREERGNMIRGAMTRLSDGGEIPVPESPPSNSGSSSDRGGSDRGGSSSSSGAQRDSRGSSGDRDRR